MTMTVSAGFRRDFMRMMIGCNQQLRHSSKWSAVDKKAESIVGYSTSFLNLRWLLTDEIANIATHFKKLIGTDHQVLKTVKRIFTQSNSPSWGIIILLLSKASGVNRKISDHEKDVNAGVLHTQRMVAEITETLKTAIFFHKSLSLKKNLIEITPDMNHGNKIAILIGDYLISQSYQILTEIRDSDIETIISSALRDLCDAELIGRRNEKNEPIPSEVYQTDNEIIPTDRFTVHPFNADKFLGKPIAEWTLRNMLTSASLLAKGCLSAVRLAGHSNFMQEQSYLFGVNLVLANQAREDLDSLRAESQIPVSLVSAPVLFHLAYDKGLKWQNLDIDTLKDTIRNGPGMQKTEELLTERRDRALGALEYFPESVAKHTLNKILMNI